MEIKLNNKQIGIIVGAAIVEACAVGKLLSKMWKERKRANDAETRAWTQGLIMQLQDFQIKELKKEIDESKAKS